MKRSSSCRNDDEVEKRGDSCEGKPVPDVWVAHKGRRNIGSVGNGSGNVQRGSRLSKTPC